jgi:hypothetical protein
MTAANTATANYAVQARHPSRCASTDQNAHIAATPCDGREHRC